MIGQQMNGQELIAALASASPHLANLRETSLFEAAIRRDEGRIAAGGALAVATGVHTGRSPRDKYIVEDEATRDHVWWEANQAMTPEAFERLAADFGEAMRQPRELYTQDLAIGAEPERQLHVRVVTELAGTRCSPATCSSGRKATRSPALPRPHHHRPAEPQGGPQTPRGAQRNGHRL